MFVAIYALLSPYYYSYGADPEGLMQALEELDYLAALDDDGNLSEIGIIMSEIPLEPQMAKALLASCEFDCVSEMLTVAAMLSGAFGTHSNNWFSECSCWRSSRRRESCFTY